MFRHIVHHFPGIFWEFPYPCMPFLPTGLQDCNFEVEYFLPIFVIISLRCSPQEDPWEVDISSMMSLNRAPVFT